MAKANSNTTRSAPVRSRGDLIRHGCGPRTSAVEVMILYGLGANVGYLILLGDVVTPSLIAAGVGVEEATLRLVVLLSSAAICALLCMLRNLAALKYAAAAAVTVGFTVAMLIRQALPVRARRLHRRVRPPGWCDAHLLRDRRVRGAAVGRLRLPGAAAHRVRAAVPHQSALCWRSCRPACRATQPPRCGLGAVVLVLVLYIPTGIAGPRFGGATQGDILNFGTAGQPRRHRACASRSPRSPPSSQHFPARVALALVQELAAAAASGGRDSRLYQHGRRPAVAEHDDAERPAVERLEILDDDLFARRGGRRRAARLHRRRVGRLGRRRRRRRAGARLGAPQVFALIGAICGGTVIFLVQVLWANLGGGARVGEADLPAAVLIAVALFIARGTASRSADVTGVAARHRAYRRRPPAAVRVSGRVERRKQGSYRFVAPRHTYGHLPPPPLLSPRAPLT